MNTYRVKIPASIISCAIFIFNTPLLAQERISGSSCVTPGLKYQYLITGYHGNVSSNHIAVFGGILIDVQTVSQKEQGSISKVSVRWNKDITQGKIYIVSKDTSSFKVTIIPPLKGGEIVEGNVQQLLPYNSVPYQTILSSASGGSCHPNYTYQWESSSDAIHWVSLTGAIDTVFSFPPLKKSTYYRRRVTETTSKTVAYSPILSLLTDSSLNVVQPYKDSSVSR